MDDRGTLVAVNPTTCHMMGMTEQQLVGRSGNSLTTENFHDDEIARVLQIRRQEIDDYSAYRVLVRGDGSTFPGEMTASAVRDPDGKLRFMVVMLADTTEREMALQRAQQSEEAMRRLTDALPVVIAQIGPDLRYRFANATYQSWLGIDPERLIGRSLKSIVGAELFPGIQHHVEAALSGTGARFEWTRTTTAGELQHLYTYYVPNFDNESTPDGFFAISFDLTERKRQEQRIESLNQELEERVELRTQRLQHLNQELEAFCYSVSHDLRGPLRIMEGFSSLLLENHAERLDQEGNDWLLRIAAASKRGGRLIDELLNLSRVTRADVNREWVDVSAIATRILSEMTQISGERRGQFKVQPGLRTWADPVLVADVLQNLIANAWKFTSKTQEAQIHIGEASGGRKRTFRISDNGVGFDMEFSSKLFSPFERLHGHEEFEGDGIGLATVHRIIQRHGGTIRAQSAPGKGAAFDFSFGDDTCSIPREASLAS